ncbi:hypothetical protein IFU23_19500 [Pantoea agglomerans]|jgi:hypothetical protein|uniref:hypothetical protein n=1 Tax=Enterobacter agglomerans TaxID=549 RepID=UPI001780C2C9|nr:hypothetical protein [Pantoea agglomerans]MBD8160275.1 hypothetical protein [Pantoea agglomerans]MBD8233330.1 hypothetical protein [Pantoea agglomerans]
MNFPKLEAAATTFTILINKDLGREVIKPITLEAPEPPPDELHFFRLVVWCYGFFFEAASDVLKECKALMKQSAPERTNRYDQGSRTINNLRTYKVHNLPPSKGNTKKLSDAKAWLAEYRTESSSIEKATEELCNIALIMIHDVTNVWEAASKDPTDAIQLFERVKNALDNAWAAHEFHQIANETADEINLSGFNAKAFCETHIAEWRQTASCFLDRESAAQGLRRTIRNTMLREFGQPT